MLQRCQRQFVPLLIHQVLAADLNGDGYKELIFTGGSQIVVYWNDKGEFSAENRLVIDIPGMSGQFYRGVLSTDIADIDGDGVLEVVIAASQGIEIRKANDLQTVWERIPFTGCSWIKIVDINNTGCKEILASYYCSNALLINCPVPYVVVSLGSLFSSTKGNPEAAAISITAVFPSGSMQ
jgi:hypothetical protein